MEFRILGPLEVVEGERAVDVAGAKHRALLAMLLLHANEVVSTERLIDALWDDDPPETAAKAVQVYVSQLRKLLGKERVKSKAGGYVVPVEDDELDLARFRRLSEAGNLKEALSLWRGPPLAEFAQERFAQSEIARLEELRLAYLEEQIERDLARGRHADLVGELEALVKEHPLRERVTGQLMRALYRSGRQAEALATYQRARRVLVDELGIEPSRALRELEQEILRQDRGLDLVAAGEAGAETTEVSRGTFVGREPELQELLLGLDDAVAGRGRLFLLSGEPGIGKSRLTDELVRSARARGARILIGRCWDGGGAPAYWPWMQSLRSYVREGDTAALQAQLGAGAAAVAQILPELREVLPGLPEPPSLESEPARFRLFDATVDFLRNASASRPIVLVLDDLHAADTPSLLLLQFVARELERSRILLLGAYRDVDPTPGPALTVMLAEVAREPVTRRLSLGGLSEHDVAKYVELTASEIASPELVAALHTGTDGNPLFVGEIVRLLAAEGRLDEAARQLAVPQSLKEVIARRLRHLSAECKRVLSLASVIGREFDVDVLAGASGLERSTLLELLDEAIAQQLVTDVPGSRARLRFGHMLFRDGLYDELPSSLRRQLHQAVGEALEQLSSGNGDSHLTELVHHFSEAIPLVDPSKAVEYARRAGDDAVSLLAPEEAVRLYEIALSLVDERERPRLLLRTARSIWMTGAKGTERTVEARDALVAAGDRDGAAEAELLLADIHFHEGRRQRVAEDMQRAVGLVRGGPVSRTTADVLDHAARFHMLADEKEQAISVGREGLAIAEQLGLDSVRAHCLSSIGVARACSGDLGGLEDLRLAFDVALAAHDGWAAWRARANLADCLLWQLGAADRAFAERHELRHLVQAAGSWPVTRWNQAYDAWESFWRGRWTETLHVCNEAIEQVEAGNPHSSASELYSLRALIGVSRSDEHALDDARTAVTLGRRAQDSRTLFPAIAFNAQIAAELGRFGEADRLLDELLLTHGPEPYHGYVVPLSLAALVRGRVGEVSARLARLGPSPWRDAAAAMLHGDNVKAAERFARIGVLPEEAQARLLAAEAFAADDRHDDADAQLARCTPFFESVGATAYVRRGEKLRMRSAATR